MPDTPHATPQEPTTPRPRRGNAGLEICAILGMIVVAIAWGAITDAIYRHALGTPGYVSAHAIQVVDSVRRKRTRQEIRRLADSVIGAEVERAITLHRQKPSR